MNSLAKFTPLPRKTKLSLLSHIFSQKFLESRRKLEEVNRAHPSLRVKILMKIQHCQHSKKEIVNAILKNNVCRRQRKMHSTNAAALVLRRSPVSSDWRDEMAGGGGEKGSAKMKNKRKKLRRLAIIRSLMRMRRAVRLSSCFQTSFASTACISLDDAGQHSMVHWLQQIDRYAVSYAPNHKKKCSIVNLAAFVISKSIGIFFERWLQGHLSFHWPIKRYRGLRTGDWRVSSDNGENGKSIFGGERKSFLAAALKYFGTDVFIA